MQKLELPSWPHIAADEIAAVTAVLQSGKINYWTGNVCRQFETDFAHYVGVEYAISLANGTLALELALKAIGIQPGDEVIVPSKTFIATASCVVACGAIPIVADIELDSHNISAATIAPCITSKTKAIIVVHFGGLACDMDPILALAQKNDLLVLEDCAQAHGAQYKGKMVGNLADVALFSFCQDKIITTGGEGGMLVTNNKDIWKRAWEYKDHGKDYDGVHAKPDPNHIGFKWLHNSFGSNYRMTEMQAAIGIQQLRKLPQWLKQRRSNATVLLAGLAKITGINVFEPSSDFVHAYYKFYFCVETTKLTNGWNRDKIMQALNEQGVPCREGSCSEIYREQAFKRLGLGPKQALPNAQRLSSTTLMLPVHPTMDESHMHAMLNIIQQVMGNATA
jgi:dTDP-4-amino-4,6-dideoxygalactose transaminase